MTVAFEIESAEIVASRLVEKDNAECDLAFKSTPLQLPKQTYTLNYDELLRLHKEVLKKHADRYKIRTKSKYVQVVAPFCYSVHDGSSCSRADFLRKLSSQHVSMRSYSRRVQKKSTRTFPNCKLARAYEYCVCLTACEISIPTCVRCVAERSALPSSRRSAHNKSHCSSCLCLAALPATLCTSFALFLLEYGSSLTYGQKVHDDV